MNIDEVINKRRSVRNFENKEVNEDVVRELIDLSRKCPSAGAIRGYEVYFTNEKVVYIDAPAYLVICTNSEAYVKRYGERGKNLYAIQDATILGAYFQLLLVSRGMASVWVGAFREGKVKRLLNIKSRPIAVIAFGYGKTN